MGPPAASGAANNAGPFQLTILILSILALAAIATDALVPLPPEISKILQGVDLVACGAFFCDFVIRFSQAESKLAFMRWGWIDLLASIPTIDVLRLGRFASVLRIVRVLRGVWSLRRLLALMFTHKAHGSIASVGVVMFLLVVSASIGILLCERGEHANIRTAGDAVWWSITTVTTVGYGDRYPVTTGGRVIASCLMFAGVGMFGALSGIIASVFLGRPNGESALAAEVRQLREELERQRGEKASAESARTDAPPASRFAAPPR